jgi:hypothetical protein
MKRWLDWRWQSRRCKHPTETGVGAGMPAMKLTEMVAAAGEVELQGWAHREKRRRRLIRQALSRNGMLYLDLLHCLRCSELCWWQNSFCCGADRTGGEWQQETRERRTTHRRHRGHPLPPPSLPSSAQPAGRRRGRRAADAMERADGHIDSCPACEPRPPLLLLPFPSPLLPPLAVAVSPAVCWRRE